MRIFRNISKTSPVSALSAPGARGQIASLTWADVDRNAGVIVARAEHVKNGRPHKIVLEAELAEIIERRWAAREYQTPNGPALSQYVFHLDGGPVGDFRKAWASACKAAGMVKPKLDENGEPVTVTVNGTKETVMVPSRLLSRSPALRRPEHGPRRRP